LTVITTSTYWTWPAIGLFTHPTFISDLQTG